MSGSAPATPWSCHLHPESWPQSSGAVFLAEAVQIVGAAMCEPWDDQTPSWMRNEVLPEVPPVYEAFDDRSTPIASVHEVYADVVRSIKSPAAFAVERFSQSEWIRSCVPNPDGGDPIPELLLRARAEEDLKEPVTRDHWEAISLLCAEKREQLCGAKARLRLVGRTLQAAVLERRLRSFMRPIGGSIERPKEIDLSWWELDDPLPRLAWCGLDIDAPLDPNAVPTHWIFVDRSGLTDKVAQANLVEFFDPGPPEQKPAGYSEQVIEDITARLLEGFASNGAELKKAGFRELVEKERGSRVSQPNWVAAWRRAAAQHPERSRSGRPKTRSKSSR